jgi:hypothetical protein
VSATRNSPSAQRLEIPALEFEITGAQAAEHAATPALQFALRVLVPDGQPIRSILLDVQIQIAARRRGYSEGAEARLLELFGAVERWGTTLRTLPWTRTTALVPPFEGETSVEVTIPCTYDLEVTAARYFAALDDGEVPLEFLFSGSVFYATPTGALQAARIGLDQEVQFGLPVSVWRQAMDRHFPGTAWLRVSEATFARLCAYKARHAFLGWDAALETLMDSEESA